MKLYEILNGKNLPAIVQDKDGKVWKVLDSDWSGFHAVAKDAPAEEMQLKTLSYQASGYELL